LSSADKELRRIGVNLAFGPTYPGDDLRYPGVWFSFDDEGLAEGLKPSFKHAEDRMQEVKRVLVSQTELDGSERDALAEVEESSAMHGELAEAVAKA